MTKAKLVKLLEQIYAAEDYFPGVLGNPVTFAGRWGLPLSKGYLKFKEQQLRGTKRRWRNVNRQKNGLAKGLSR